MVSKMQQVRVPMQDEQIAQLAQVAKEQGKTQAALIRDLLVAMGYIEHVVIKVGKPKKAIKT